MNTNSKTDESLRSAIGSALGAMAGDSVGLVVEGLSPARRFRLFGDVTGPRLLPGGRGLISDDTEHVALVLDALSVSGGDPDRFEMALASGLRRWFLCGPPGIGLATLRACVRLCLGFPPGRSGVFSAGNGPCMRAAILGAMIPEPAHRHRLLDISSRITHTDVRSLAGARAIAMASRCFADRELSPAHFRRAVSEDSATEALLATTGLTRHLDDALVSVESGETTRSWTARTFPNGPTGYVLQTVPAALHAAWSHPNDVRAGVVEAVAMGGDTDTIAAIAGGIIGANPDSLCWTGERRNGKSAIMEPWLTQRRLREMAESSVVAVRSHERGPSCRCPIPLAIARNSLFAAIVIAHGFRRLFP